MKHFTPPTAAMPLDGAGNADKSYSDISATETAASSTAPPTDAHRLEEGIRNLARLRKEAAAHIDRLMELLDLTDGEADLEETGDDEPSLGSTNDHNGNGTSYVTSLTPDAEGPEEDLEPSLCGLTVELRGNDQELEDEHDGCEDGSDAEEVNEDGDGKPDDEPSLGWAEGTAQGQGRWGGTDDREEAVGARPPQDRTAIDRPPIEVERSYRTFVTGLPPAIKRRVRRDSGVIAR